MNHRAVACLLFGVSIAAAACSKGASSYASSCPIATELPACPIAPGAMDCSGPHFACGLDSLPTGVTCSSPAQCSIPIFPCPDWQTSGEVQRTDGYICSCVDGRWSCDDCSEGASVCSNPPLADDASDDAEAASGSEGGADAAFDGGAPIDSSSAAAPDAQPRVGCEQFFNDAAMVTFAFTGNEAEAGPDDANIEWFDDAGMSESCGPSSCDARCPSGTTCAITFLSHGLQSSGTCP